MTPDVRPDTRVASAPHSTVAVASASRSGRLDDRRLQRARARIEDEDAQQAVIESSLETQIARHAAEAGVRTAKSSP